MLGSFETSTTISTEHRLLAGECPSAGDRLPHRLIVPSLLLLAATLAISSLLQDSITFDETKHFASGLSYWKTGDFRLSPDTPPLAQMLAALPSLWMDHHWPGPKAPGWGQGDVWPFAQYLLFELNDGDRWIVPARCMMVILLLATCLAVYAGARSLFGRTEALLALVVACLSPTLLAHGRLVTTDLPVALACLLVLITWTRLFELITWWRLGAGLLAVSIASLTKFSWPLVMPSLLVMGALAVLRRRPIKLDLQLPRRAASVGARPALRIVTPRWHRGLLVAAIAAMTGVVAYGAIWTCYGWRYAPFHEVATSEAAMIAQGGPGTEAAVELGRAWEITMQDNSGEPLRGLTAEFVYWARRYHALPEAYIYGLAFTLKTVRGQSTYLCGKTHDQGQPSYFPIAFAIKTPIATLLMFVGGTVALFLGPRPKHPHSLLLVGLITFVLVYTAVAICSEINLGHRHLLPIYPPLIILSSRVALFLRCRVARWVVAAGVALLIYANVSIYPQYLCYFNELVGGPTNGHRYLVDSNLDWGQDLKRLSRYARQNPQATIKLAYFGSADPQSQSYGIDCDMLPSQPNRGGRAPDLSPGTYVVSLTQLYGVWTRQIRPAFWDSPINQRQYQALTDYFARPPPENETKEEQGRRAHAEERFALARCWRLLNRLSQRPPDDRIGWSLFVFHLTQSQIDHLLEP